MKLLFALLLILSSRSEAEVWLAENKWNNDWEQKYSRWVADEIESDIFSNPQSKWNSLETDCSDAAYFLRTIFSYENKLPVEFLRTENGSGVISEKMNRWDHLSDTSKVIEFLKYIAINTDTGTLARDTYPIKMSNEIFQPGIIYLNIPTVIQNKKRSGHAEVVRSIQDNGYYLTWYSSTPPRVRNLISNRNPFTWPMSRQAGFRAFIWPQYRALEMSQYSNEQFDLASWQYGIQPSRKQIFQWHESIRKKIQKRPPTFEERREIIIESICNLWQARIDEVQISWNRIKQNNMKCLNSELMDEMSTFQRDARIKEAYGQLNDILYWYKNESGNQQLEGSVKDAQSELQKCIIRLDPSYQVDAWELFLRMIDGQIYSDAKWSPGVRWGAKQARSSFQCR
jgi:hypothetical protein